jgi:hypothetical protein
VFGVYGYPAVLVAHRIKLFPLLAEKPRTLTEVCEALHLARRPAETVLAAAASLGFLELRDGRYANTALAEDYLLETSPMYFGSYWDLIIDNEEVCSYASIEKALLTDTPQVFGGQEVFRSLDEQAALAQGFTRGMHGISMGPALAWPHELDLAPHQVMLDIGGGSGAHSIGAVATWPRMRAIVFDIGPVCEVAQEFIAEAGLADRIETHTGDMWEDTFPAADLHFYSNIFHDWPAEKGRFLAAKSFASLPSGGRIFAHEVLYNDDKTGPFSTAGYSMVMMGWTTGEQYSSSELATLLTDAGFRDVEEKLTFGYYSTVSAVKP